MIVLVLQRVEVVRCYIPLASLPKMAPTVVVTDDDNPTMELARRSGSYYARATSVPSPIPDCKVTRYLRLSDRGEMVVIDELRHADWRVKAIYRSPRT